MTVARRSHRRELFHEENRCHQLQSPDGVEYGDPGSGTFVGPTRLLISSDTLQVSDYRRYSWTMFDPEAKQARHETGFPKDRQKAFDLGARMAADPWGGQ